MYNGISKVFAIGFYTKADHIPQTYYINERLDSDEVVLRCIDDLVTSKYSGYTFYVHNLGSYDVVLLIKILLSANVNCGEEKYILSIYYKDDKIICLTIKVGVYSIKLVDSWNILAFKLIDMAEMFNLDIKKDIFPYKFVTNETVFYTGRKPAKHFYQYEYEHELDKETYDLIPDLYWGTKAETIKYLEKDLLYLFEVINKFSDYIYRKHKIQVSGSLTISYLAMKLFLIRFNKAEIPLINKRSLYEDIKKSYFGAIT